MRGNENTIRTLQHRYRLRLGWMTATCHPTTNISNLNDCSHRATRSANEFTGRCRQCLFLLWHTLAHTWFTISCNGDHSLLAGITLWFNGSQTYASEHIDICFAFFGSGKSERKFKYAYIYSAVMFSQATQTKNLSQIMFRETWIAPYTQNYVHTSIHKTCTRIPSVIISCIRFQIKISLIRRVGRMCVCTVENAPRRVGLEGGSHGQLWRATQLIGDIWAKSSRVGESGVYAYRWRGWW